MTGFDPSAGRFLKVYGLISIVAELPWIDCGVDHGVEHVLNGVLAHILTL